MFEKFLQFFLPQLKEYNKKKKGNEVIFTENEFNELVELMNYFIQLDLTHFVSTDKYIESEELHLRLLGLTNFIYNVSLKRKYKDRVLDTFFDDVLYLQFAKQQLGDVDVKTQLGNEYDLYLSSAYALKSIDKHLTLLVSKTVDYIPNTDKAANNLNAVIDMFDGYKGRLVDFANEGLLWWVYLYTEHVNNVPISLRYLNVYDNLSDKIDDWSDNFGTTKICEILRKRGYEVFAGWGNLSETLTFDKTKGEATCKVTNPVEKPKHDFVHLTEDTFRQACTAVHEHTAMFYYDDKFQFNNTTHYELYTRSIAAVLWNLVPGRNFHRNTVKSILSIVRSAANRTNHLTRRRDRKYWYSENSLDAILSYIDEYNANKVTGHVITFANHIYDITVDTPGMTFEKEVEVMNAHHGYLARVLNKIFYSKGSRYTSEEVSYFMRAFQDVVMPKYFTMVPEEKQWLFRSNLEFVLNIKDEGRVTIAIEKLREWFGQRHTADVNKTFLESNIGYFKYMSYSNKKILLDKLSENPIDVVSYAGSMDVYKTIIDICKQDIENPIMTHRVESVEITDDGVVVKPRDE